MSTILKGTRIVLILLLLFGVVLFFPEPTQCHLGQVMLTAEQMPMGWEEEGYVGPALAPHMGCPGCSRYVLDTS